MSQVNSSKPGSSTGTVKICALVLALFLSAMSNVRAQAPDWSMNPASFQYTMNIVAFLNVDGNILQQGNDKVGAFVGNELRGVASPIYVASADRYLAFLTIFSNKQGEQVTFRIFDSAANKTVAVDAEVTFEIDGQLGSTFQAFSIADPPLRKEADITQFFFTDADTVSTSINPGTVQVVVKFDQNLTLLTPAFTVSEGARLLLDRSPLETGALSLDFTEPLTVNVLSEDESVINSYVVEVINQQAVGEGFSCTNVITPNHDGANDQWIVQDVFKYEDWEFMIFDANGRELFKSIGYQNDWDGTLNGSKITRGKYFYLIRDPETGTTYSGDILVLY